MAGPSLYPTNPEPRPRSYEAHYGLPFAGFWIRFGAFIIDAFFLAFLSFGAAYAAVTLSDLPWSAPLVKNLSGLSVVLVGLYMIGFPAVWGATPGKKLLALQIVTRDRLDHPRISDFIIRFLSSAASGLLLGLGYLWMVVSLHKQTLHDKAAGTVVIRTEEGSPARTAILMASFFILILAGSGIVATVRSGQWQTYWKRLVPSASAGPEAEPDSLLSYDSQSCLDEAAKRMDECHSMACLRASRDFLGKCLKNGKRSQAFCAGVPSPTLFYETIRWRSLRCQKMGSSNDFCPDLLAAVQRHCDELAHRGDVAGGS